MSTQREQITGPGRAGGMRRVRGLTLALALVCLLATPSLAPAEALLPVAPAATPDPPGDEYWAAGFNLPGMDDPVNALAVGPDGSLYAGGRFTTAGGVAANSIARWDGTSWHPLDNEMDDGVLALAIDVDGTLYAGGQFTTANGVEVNHIASWDGTSWHSLENGTDDTVRALAIGPEKRLYTGGSFSTAGGVEVDRIARWDGITWHPAGDGVSAPVLALAFQPDGALFAAGTSTTLAPRWSTI